MAIDDHDAGQPGEAAARLVQPIEAVAVVEKLADLEYEEFRLHRDQHNIADVPLYFLVHDAGRFATLRSALAASWRMRSFAPCIEPVESLLPEVRAFQERFHVVDEPLLDQLGGMAFDRHAWRLLVGEVLLYGAAEIPEVPTVPETLTYLLAPGHPIDVNRERFLPVQQAHFGTRDLAFGGAVYRPEATGLNDVGDVARLAAYLESVDPNAWRAEQLAGVPGLENEADRAEELDVAKAWFPLLCELYRRSHEEHRIVVCDLL